MNTMDVAYFTHALLEAFGLLTIIVGLIFSLTWISLDIYYARKNKNKR